MFSALTYKPYEDMTVEDHVFEFEILFIFILMDEGCLKFTFLSYIELLHLDLLGEVHAVLGHSLEDGLLCTPVDGKLLVLLVVIKVLDLIFGKSLLFNSGKIPVEGLDVDSHLLVIMDDDRYIVLSMCDADVCSAVLKVRLAVVMMVEIHLLLEHFVDECPYCQLLSSLAFAAEKLDLFKLVCRDGGEAHQFLFRFGYMPYGYFRFVVKFLS